MVGAHVMVEAGEKKLSYMVFGQEAEIRDKVAGGFSAWHCAVLEQSPGTDMAIMPFFVTVYTVAENDSATRLFYALMPALTLDITTTKLDGIFDHLKAKKIAS